MRKFANQDKMEHFVVGAAIAALPLAARMFGEGYEAQVLVKIGFLLCIVAALSKELMDASGTFHVPDGADFVATVVGGLSVVVMFL